MFNRILNIFIFSLTLVACSTNSKNDQSNKNSNCVAETPLSRTTASAGKCEDLFKSKIQVHIVEDDQPINDRNNIHEATIKFMDEVMPKSIDETFWKVIEQMSRVEDTKLRLDSDKLFLTRKINDHLNLHTTYVYNSASNNFVLKKIEYTEQNKNTMLLSSEPLYKDSNQVKPDLALTLSELASGTKDQTIGIPGYISHAVYKKIEAESANLALFTTHELLKISQLTGKTRLAKYQFLLAGRKVRNFLVRDFMQELISKPIKTIVISVASITVLSHTDFLKKIVSIKNETPDWVAPSVVKMAGRYPESTQVEIVHLMKEINNNEKESIKIFAKDFETKKKLINIDDVDQFTIQTDPKHKKTYFVLSHEHQNGTVDMYSVEIDPARYPQLAQQAETASEVARPILKNE